MNETRFGEGVQIVPLLVKEGAVNDASAYVKVNNAHWVTLMVAFGDADTAITITVESSSAGSSNASETTIPFVYRLSGAASAGSDTWSAVTTADSTGFALTAATDTGKVALIEIDPRSLADAHNYLRVVTAATSYNAPTPAEAIVAFLNTRYAQLLPLSST